MSLNQLLKEGRLQRHKTSKEEILDLWELVDRDWRDAQVFDISLDRQLATAYNAALQLGVIALSCSGFRTRGAAHHMVVFMALKFILENEYVKYARFFNTCRIKRNTADYDRAGHISQTEVDELITAVSEFRDVIKKWAQAHCEGMSS